MASIEFAIGSIAVLMCIVGAVEFGRYFYIKNKLDYAVTEAGRYAITNPAATDSAISSQVTTKAPSGVTPTVSVTSTTSGTITYKTITATGTVALASKLFPFVSLGVTSRTRVPVM
ncbi:MAG: pilus assembly protein [Alphaproteobacteria bacterium]|nr:pilus assembly protein [Alphaproteobacteria bacterium]MCW5744169.1 pilus assembly protein [Alphaproteobacteria bacterium]